MPYFLLMGTISSRTSLVTACSETARLTPISSPARAIIGTTPEVERSEEHTSELQSLMRISYAVFCLKKKKINKQQRNPNHKHKLHTNRNQAPQQQPINNP